MGEPGGSKTEGSSGDEKAAEPLQDGQTNPISIATMTADELKQFIDTGRTGRRNALPDVSLPEVNTTSTAGVAEALESLTVQNSPPAPSQSLDQPSGGDGNSDKPNSDS